MPDTQTQSGQRPPNATRPTDSDVAYRLRDTAVMLSTACASAAEYGTGGLSCRAERAKLKPEKRGGYQMCELCTRADLLRATADALDAAPARLTPEQWREAVERAARENYRLNSAQNGDRREWSRARPSTKTGWKITTAEALRAAFPHLAPNPED